MNAQQLLTIAVAYAVRNGLFFDMQDKAGAICDMVIHAEKHPRAKLASKLLKADAAFAEAVTR